MEAWNPQRTAAWLCSDRQAYVKYAEICRNEDISGRALLLLASKDPGYLRSVLNLKKGPERVLMNRLKEHLEKFEREKSKEARTSVEEMNRWTCEELCSWLRELGIPEECLREAEEEEIDGPAFLLMRNELRNCMKLKVGPWIVLEHELSLLDEDNRERESPNESLLPMQDEPKKPLALGDPITKTVSEPPNISANKENSGTDSAGKPCYSSTMEDLNEPKKPQTSEDRMTETVSDAPNKSINEENSRTDSADKPCSSLALRHLNESKERLASEDPLTKTSPDVLTKPASSKEEETPLSFLKMALKLDIENSRDSEERTICQLRSIFVKRGKGSNSLEQLFIFIVMTKEELKDDQARILWKQIIRNSVAWVKLLSSEDSKKFLWNEASKELVHSGNNMKISLRDGSVTQIFLDRLTPRELKEKSFVILIDKQLEPKPNQAFICRFSFDRKKEKYYNIKMEREGNYHAAFDVSDPSQTFEWSDYFNSLKNRTGDLRKVTINPPKSRDQGPTRDPMRYQILRPFGVDHDVKPYVQGRTFSRWETGTKDMITPIHECKIFRTDVNPSVNDMVKKFVYDTLRFACACLNERTNGTIHFGVADENQNQNQTCGHEPREIVGSQVTEVPLYNEKLTEYIGKCFVGRSGRIVPNCIRPAVFIPVRSSLSGEDLINTVVIEVDVEPSYSLCRDDIFKVCLKGLDRGKKDREATAYIRSGSHTVAIDDANKMEEFVKDRLPKLVDERKYREKVAQQRQSPENEESIQQLSFKFQRLLCANKNFLDSSVYPILVVSKPHADMSQTVLKETFCFIQKIKWLTVIDFDDKGSDSNGLCQVFKSVADSSLVDIHEAEDYDGDENTVDDIYYKTHWIFGNGYLKLEKEALSFKQWNNSKRKKGLLQVIQSLSKRIPDIRAVVLFLLLSEDYRAMADTFKDFCTCFGGPNQLVYVAETSEIVRSWEDILSCTCLEENELQERGIIGMSWPEFQECVLQMVLGPDKEQRCVIMTSGSFYPVGKVSFNCLDIVSAKECEELNNLSSAERSKLSSEVETHFYRGYPVTWNNFWFTDNRSNHVLRRDNYTQLKDLLEKIYSRKSEGRVQTITIYHEIGAGASTMARQALWDFRCNPKFPFRCAVVTRADDNTSKELLQLRKIGYREESGVPFPPVIALVEDTDDILFQELRSQVVEQASKVRRTNLPVCVFLYCKTTQKPYECYEKEKETSVYLEQRLSKEEVEWFKDKYTEMKRKADENDPVPEFDDFANDNLISFVIMKENYNPKYASSVVSRNLDLVTTNELSMLKFISLLNLYNLFPVFTASFDEKMLPSSLFLKREFRDWVEYLSDSARIFLKDFDFTSHYGTGRAIAIVHRNIARELLRQIIARERKSVSQVTLEFLNSDLLQREAKSFTSVFLCDEANRMLKHRRKYEYGDDEQTKFSPLVEEILYGESYSGERETTETKVLEAVEVLKAGLEKFQDATLAQQMARLCYVNAKCFVDKGIEECFRMAVTFCNQAIEMSPNNTFFFDTMGRIYESKMKVLYGSFREGIRTINQQSVILAMELAFEAMKWFQKSIGTSGDNQNPFGFQGEISMIFYLLNILRCTTLFLGQVGWTKLQAYLSVSQVIPPEVEELWSKFHEPINGLRNACNRCMEALTEEVTIYKGNSVQVKLLPCQIARFKAQYLIYFGDDNLDVHPENARERWEYRWQKINQILVGDIFWSVFKIDHSKAHEKLTSLRTLAGDNYCEELEDGIQYKDLLLLITTNMALHSPYGDRQKKKSNRNQLIKEYIDVFKVVDQLLALEECEGNKKIYAHLFRVMFLWPRKEFELSDYHLKDFYEALQKLKVRWNSKCKRHVDTDKSSMKKMYKRMSFKKETRQYTTLFFLGKGKGLDVFVHINELPLSQGTKGTPAWEDERTKQRLERLTGVVESRNIIKMKNPLDANQTIDIYYSSFREGGFSKEEVSFYLGFSWPQPTAFDVKYTKEDHDQKSVEFNELVFGDNFQSGSRKFVFMAPEEYTLKRRKILKILADIKVLQAKRDRGEKLEENQVTHLIFITS